MKQTPKQSENKRIVCPICKSGNIVKRGFFQTEVNGRVQRYYCKTCNKKFILQTAFYRMRNNPIKITQSIDLFYRGVSTRKVQEHLGVFYPHNASNVSIYNWIVKYSKMISNYTNRLKLNVGQEVQVDEMECHRRQHHKKGERGVDKNWFIDSICPDTKFLISSEFSKTRGSQPIKAVMSRIKDKTESQIQIVTTDGLIAYQKVIKKVWGWNKQLKKYNVLHNRNVMSEDDGHFNHPIERLHNNVRARTKVMRGFHGSLYSANKIMKGFEIYYNFITKHQQIKCCPYELALTDEDTKAFLKEVKNKWLGLIYLTKEAGL